MDARAHKYVDVIAVMHPDTLYMYMTSEPCRISPFFAAFNVSVTLNLADRSFEIIHFGGNR